MTTKMRAAVLVVGVMLLATWGYAQGTVGGRVRDRYEGALPGVDIVAVSASGTEWRAMTDSAGRYEIANLPFGTYSLRAHLSGFVDRTVTVSIVPAAAAATIDLVLCVRFEEEIEVTMGLNELWRQSDAVFLVEIRSTTARPTGCPEQDFEHRASVVDVLKDRGGRRIGDVVSFIQENRRGESAPYGVGQRMIVFLRVTPGGFRRVAGRQSVFVVRGDRITSANSVAKANGLRLREFLATLRGLAGKVGPR